MGGGEHELGDSLASRSGGFGLPVAADETCQAAPAGLCPQVLLVVSCQFDVLEWMHASMMAT